MPLKIDLRSRRIWLVALLATSGLGAWLWFIDQHLRNPVAPDGIVSFELAYTGARTQAILDSWRGTGFAKAWLSMAVDILFPIAYATLIASSIAHQSVNLAPEGRPAKVAARLVLVPGVAAACDYVENAALCYALQFGADPVAAFVAGAFASMKFALLAVAIAYVLGVATIKLRRILWS